MRASFYRYITVLMVILGAPELAHAGVYTFTDANGVIHFTNKPTDPRYAGMVRVAFLPDPVRPTTVPLVDPNRYIPLVKKTARELQIDEALLRAVIAVESGYDARAVSSRGAVGLMQLMPETARRYGVTNLYDPAQTIRGGARYLRDLMGKFNNDLSLALAAYNAGEDAIVQYGNRIPPYRETLMYVPKVLDTYRRYKPAIR